MPFPVIGKCEKSGCKTRSAKKKTTKNRRDLHYIIQIGLYYSNRKKNKTSR